MIKGLLIWMVLVLGAGACCNRHETPKVEAKYECTEERDNDRVEWMAMCVLADQYMDSEIACGAKSFRIFCAEVKNE